MSIPEEDRKELEAVGFDLTDQSDRISQLEAQLQEADVTATAMGLALTEARMENERMREALKDLRSCSCDASPYQFHRPECAINIVDDALGKEGA